MRQSRPEPRFELQDISLGFHLKRPTPDRSFLLFEGGLITLACRSHGRPVRLIWGAFRSPVVGYHFMINPGASGAMRRNVPKEHFLALDLRPMLEENLVKVHGMDALKGALVAGTMAAALDPLKNELISAMQSVWPVEREDPTPDGAVIVDERHSQAQAMRERCRAAVDECRGRLEAIL